MKINKNTHLKINKQTSQSVHYSESVLNPIHHTCWECQQHISSCVCNIYTMKFTVISFTLTDHNARVWFSLVKDHIGWPCHIQQALGRRLSNWFTVCLTPLGPWTPLYPQCVCLCALGNTCACMSVCICVPMCWRKIETERKRGG